MAIVRRGLQQVDMLGAGVRDAGPDGPATPLIGDALWVGRRDAVSAFYMWDGRRLIYEEHLR